MIKNRYLSTVSWGAILSAAGAAGTAHAAPITVAQTLTPGVNVSSSGSGYTGQFDLTGLLPPGMTAGNSTAVSAFVTAYGYSAAAPQTSDTYTAYTPQGSYYYYYISGYYSYYYIAGYYSYGCGWSTCYAPYYATGYGAHYATGTTTYYYRDHTQSVQDGVDDTMLLTVGGQSAQDDTDEVTATLVNNGQTYVGYYTNGYSVRQYLYQNNYTDTDLLYGEVQVQFALDTTNLADLSADGILGFDIAALLGQFQINSIVLSADFEQNTAVSGPGAGPVMAAVLAVLAATRRRARRGDRR